MCSGSRGRRKLSDLLSLQEEHKIQARACVNSSARKTHYNVSSNDTEIDIREIKINVYAKRQTCEDLS